MRSSLVTGGSRVRRGVGSWRGLLRAMTVPARAPASEYLERQPPEGFLAVPEGSWGKNGGNEVWLNPQTAWTWSHIYPAEETVRRLATEGKWRDGGMGERIARQLCRELLLLESSDWQFLITTEEARDYAEQRFLSHLEQFLEAHQVWQEFVEKGSLAPESEQRLADLERRDSLFAEIDPGLWVQREPA